MSLKRIILTYIHEKVQIMILVGLLMIEILDLVLVLPLVVIHHLEDLDEVDDEVAVEVGKKRKV